MLRAALRRLPAHCLPRRLSTLALPETSGSALRWAVGGWSFFIAENLILSENRAHIIEALGDDEKETNYHRVYGSLSTAATASILYAYVVKNRPAVTLRPALSPPWRSWERLAAGAMKFSEPHLAKMVMTCRDFHARWRSDLHWQAADRVVALYESGGKFAH